MKKRKLSVEQISGIFLILFALIMNGSYFIITSEYSSPLVDFEFSRNQNDVTQIFTDDQGIKDDIMKGINVQNKIDFVFMIIYSSFLFLVFRKLFLIKNESIMIVGMILSVIILTADFTENIALLNITAKLQTGKEYGRDLQILIPATHAKWYMLTIVFAILSYFYFRENISGKILSVLSLLPLIFAIISIISKLLRFEILMSNSVMFSFVLLIIRVFNTKTKDTFISFYRINAK